MNKKKFILVEKNSAKEPHNSNEGKDQKTCATDLVVLSVHKRVVTNKISQKVLRSQNVEMNHQVRLKKQGELSVPKRIWKQLGSTVSD